MECRMFMRKNGTAYVQRTRSESGSDVLSDTEELILEMLETISDLSEKLKLSKNNYSRCANAIAEYERSVCDVDANIIKEIIKEYF